MSKRVLKIEGMSCAHCVGHVKKALAALQGVTEVQVDLTSGEAEITLEGTITDEVLASAIDEAGYTLTGVN